MQAGAFDGIARELGEVSTRRSIFRLLGGAAALGAGLALGGDSLAKGKHRGDAKAAAHGKSHGKTKERGGVAAQKKQGSITICFQNQTRTVKKKGSQTKYPGATVGPCPATPPPPQPQPQPQPAVCTSFILSGGPTQSDPITIDDDGSILNVTTGNFLIIDNNGMAGPLNPVLFAGKVGDVLRVRATDWGGCRSFSPLWVHCAATGQKKQLFTGYNGANCSYAKGDFLDMTITLSL